MVSLRLIRVCRTSKLQHLFIEGETVALSWTVLYSTLVEGVLMRSPKLHAGLSRFTFIWRVLASLAHRAPREPFSDSYFMALSLTLRSWPAGCGFHLLPGGRGTFHPAYLCAEVWGHTVEWPWAVRRSGRRWSCGLGLQLGLTRAGGRGGLYQGVNVVTGPCQAAAWCFRWALEMHLWRAVEGQQRGLSCPQAPGRCLEGHAAC